MTDTYMADSTMQGPCAQLPPRGPRASRQRHERRATHVTPDAPAPATATRANIRPIPLYVPMPAPHMTGPQLARRARATHRGILARLSYVADGSPTPSAQRRTVRTILADADELAALLDALCAIEAPMSEREGPPCP